MRCPSCGRKNADGSYGCQHCGSPFPCPISKKLFASPLALTALIAQTAAILFSLLYTVTGFASAPNTVPGLTYLPGIQKAGTPANYAVLTFSLVAVCLSALTAIGSWMTYASAANRRITWMKTGGLMLVKVIQYIELAALACLLVFLDIAFFAIALIGANFEFSLALSYISSPVIIVTSLFGLLLLYCALSIKMINTMIETIRTGMPSDRISRFVAVFTCIAGGCPILLLFTGWNLFSLFANLCSAASAISFGIFLFSYRKHMQAGMSKS